MVPRTGSLPRRARHLIPPGLPRRGELIAACAVALVLAHLLLAQLTLVLAVVFVTVSRTSRWRLWWLLAPAAAGLAWTLAAGPDQALAGFAAGPSAVLTRLGFGNAAGQAGHPLAAFSGIGGWLPRQFPVALPLAAAEAAVFGGLTWLHTDEWAVTPARPGAAAALRAAVARRVVRSGAVVTRDGCALGLVPATGAVAELRWAEAARGVLVTGADDREVTVAALQVVHAALRRRKPVIVLGDGPGSAVDRALTAACQATGTPLVRLGAGASAAGAAAAGAAAAGAPHVRAQPSGALADRGTASASQLWGRSRGLRASAPGQPDPEAGPGSPDPGHVDPGHVDPGQADLSPVIAERSAALLRADSPQAAAGACAGIGSLAADLRRIGVDGDALVWVPRGERVPAPALAGLIRAGAAGGLSALVGTTSPAAAAELAAQVAVVLIRRVADPDLAAVLAARTGARLLPPSAAMALDGRRPGTGPPAAPAAAPVAAPPVSAELVAAPVVPARVLLTLGPGEFVLAVSGPPQRLVAPGQLVPARLPPAPGQAYPSRPEAGP